MCLFTTTNSVTPFKSKILKNIDWKIFTGAHHVITAGLCLVIQSSTRRSSMDRWRIGAGTFTCTSSAATRDTTVAPDSPLRPVSVNWEKKNNLFVALVNKAADYRN